MKFKSFKIVKLWLMIKIKFLARKFLYDFSPLNTFKGKGKDLDPHLDQYLWLTIRMRIPETPKNTAPTDPDPEYWI